MEYNLPRIVDKYANLAYQTGMATLSMGEEDAAGRLINYMHRLQEKLGLPTKLKDLGVQESDLPEMAIGALASSSLQANPRIAKREELIAILEASF
jgi:alcohol dehydrogenase class IV